jgi:7-cyano-7-deazaguanine synthase
VFLKEGYMQHTDSAVVLFSGGQDSTTCLYWARDRIHTIHPIFIDYGQRHLNIEIQSAGKITRDLDMPLYVYNIDVFAQMGDSALVSREVDVNAPHPRDSKLPASFVPGRNLFFILIAAAHAYKHDISTIIIGANHVDYSGYPDCRPDTISALEKAINFGMGGEFQIVAPVINLSKTEIVALAASLNCIGAMEFTHTCYEGKFPPCGACPSCKIRAEGFAKVGIEDPLIRRARRHTKDRTENILFRSFQ